jgi:hypothetical protein
MPYFFILPAFVLWVAALGVAIVVTSLHRPAVWFRPYVVSVLVWSSLGFVLSTIVYAGVLVAAAVAMDRLLPGRASIIGGIGMGLVISSDHSSQPRSGFSAAPSSACAELGERCYAERVDRRVETHLAVRPAHPRDHDPYFSCQIKRAQGVRRAGVSGAS